MQSDSIFPGLPPLDFLTQHVGSITWFSVAFLVVSSLGFFTFVAVLAFRTKAPGRYLLFIGCLTTVVAKNWIGIERAMDPLLQPSLGYMTLFAAISHFGMVLSAIGCVRLALWLVREKRKALKTADA